MLAAEAPFEEADAAALWQSEFGVQEEDFPGVTDLAARLERAQKADVEYSLTPEEARLLDLVQAEIARQWAQFQDSVGESLRALLDDALLDPVLDADETLRYRQHLLLREDALRRLPDNERAAALARHADIYVAVIGSAAEADDRLPVERGYAQIEAVLRRSWRAWQGADDDIGTGLSYPRADALHYLNALGLGCWLAYWSLAGLGVDAVRWLKRAAQVASLSGDKEAASMHLGNLGLAHADLGQVDHAIQYHEQALAISREIGDRRNEGVSLGNLGNAQRALGQVERAIQYYEQALAIAREIGNRRGEGIWLGNLGNAYRDLGQVERAARVPAQALAISREIGDRRVEALLSTIWGSPRQTWGRWSEAIQYYEQGLAISREIGNRQGRRPPGQSGACLSQPGAG